jgi:carbonic anhydrase
MKPFFRVWIVAAGLLVGWPQHALSRADLPLPPLEFDYHASPFGVVDTGRYLQLNFDRAGAIELQGRSYLLRRLEFHQPSRANTVGGSADLVAHLVHKDAAGHTAIVVVRLEQGARQPFIQAVWRHWPLQRRIEADVHEGVDPMRLLPSDRRYDVHASQDKKGALWVSMRNSVAISAEQLAAFGPNQQ